MDPTRPCRRVHRQQDREQARPGDADGHCSGIVGAIVGGLLFSLFGATGITGFNLYSLIVAVIGSVVVLWLYHLFDRRRPI
jgi:predicted lipid-binding transport protein (Tim44 family)